MNDKPVVSGQSLSVNEDETVTITLLGSDEDKDDLTFTVLSQPNNGALSGAGANLTYTPKANYYGSDSFTFKANDGVADSNTATVSINVKSVNDKPVVSGQSLSVNEDETVTITLLGSDEDKDDLTFTVLSQPNNGALSGAGANLTYTPKANYYGSDSFTFKANDGVADSNTATVSINVKSVNDKPVVSGQSLSVNEDETVMKIKMTITLLGSDYYEVIEDKDDLTFTVLSQPNNGALSGAGANLTYTPKANYYGSDSFTFKANDGVADSDTATVAISVIKAKLSEGVYFEENFDGVNLGPFESDSESNGDGTDWASEGPAGWVMRKNNGHGLTGGGSDVVEFDGWTFLDPVSWNATAEQNRSNFTKGTGVIAVADSDEYDDKDDASLNATLSTPSIDISDASGSKLILKYDSSWRKEPQIGSVSVSYDGGVQIELLKLDGNSPDAYNETVELELNNPSGAKFAVISWNYEGHNNWWWAIDNIRIYEKVVENTAPLVSGQSLSVNEDETVAITLLGSDEDKDDLTFTVLSQPNNGALSGTGANLTYTPKANYNGSDSFTFKANDGEKDSNTATVAISVKSVNDLPVVFSQSVIVDEDGSVSITLKAQDNDGDNLKYTVVSQPKNGTLSGAPPKLTYSPKANFNGDDSFTVKVFDGLADSNTATVAISVKAMEKPKLMLSKNEYLNDEKIRVDFRGGPGNKKDWIGIFRKGQKPGGIESVRWNYVDGTKSGANAKSSGLLEFNSLSEGSYEVFYLENDGYKILSSATFNVISIEKTIKLEYGKYSNIPVEFEIWDSVVIEYSGGQGNSKDWLGARLANQNGNFGNWINLSSEFKSGKVEFERLKPGLYDLWWLTNNRQSASAKFKVLASNQGPINPDTSWTVFVYGNADHDLTSSWLEDLEEMKMAGGNENFNIVVFSDLNGNENGEETASLNKYGVKEEHRKK